MSNRSKKVRTAGPGVFRRRRLVLLDHENLVDLAEGTIRRQQLQWVLRLLRLRPERDRIIAGASSSYTCFEIKRALDGMGAVHLLHGPDGAERAIEANLDPRWAAASHDELVIGSGDRYFLEMAKEFHRSNRLVTVVSQSGSLSIDLRNEADIVLTLPSMAPPSVQEAA